MTKQEWINKTIQLSKEEQAAMFLAEKDGKFYIDFSAVDNGQGRKHSLVFDFELKGWNIVCIAKNGELIK